MTVSQSHCFLGHHQLSRGLRLIIDFPNIMGYLKSLGLMDYRHLGFVHIMTFLDFPNFLEPLDSMNLPGFHLSDDSPAQAADAVSPSVTR